MKKGFSTKRDGFNSKLWGERVMEKGKALVIAKTTDNFIFGGYTKAGWTEDRSKWSVDYGDNGFIPDPDAFIFSLRNDKNDREPMKFPVKQEEVDYVLWYDHLGLLPSFGRGILSSDLGNEYYSDFSFERSFKGGVSNFGVSFELPDGIEQGTNEAKSYLAGSPKSWEIDELETFFI
ncbi:hypothetical protein M0811_06527 [Anaeramoeba ignava]|uniref:TLDc domain-containing protein n=1 Tax=Anaeramoeba ignava TaxID=1746090 RepID=A0A9Q0LNU3_ANAIG|nr:hypothetical protein M0811_06527 [Anaeramoeba ignava]